MSTRTVGKCRT